MVASQSIIYWLHTVLHFESLLPDSSGPFPKCCKQDQIVAANGQNCVSVSHSHSLPDYVNAVLHPDPSRFSIQSGFPCPKFKREISNKNLSIRYIRDRSIAETQIDDEVTPFVLDWGRYCIDVIVLSKDLLGEKEPKYRQILIACSQFSATRIPATVWLYFFFFAISILLIVATIIPYIAVQEFRVKVKNKCLVCFLTFLALMLISVFWNDVSYYYWPKAEGTSYFFRFLWVYAGVCTFCWLNVMCIHLWRSVTSMKSVPSRTFYVYIVYALGLPLVCQLLDIIDYALSVSNNFERYRTGGVFTNPLYLYFWNVVTILLLINVCLFGRVGYFIWNQQKQWKGKGDLERKRFHCQQKKMFFQLLRLLVIMGLDWIGFLIIFYFRIERIYIYGLKYLNWIVLCPGYLIFVNHVWCDEQVVSIFRQTFTKLGTVTKFKKTASSLDVQNTASSSLAKDKVQG